MLIIQQPNNWSCLPAAFATVTGIPLETLLELVGHDGSEIIFNDLPEPLCRRSFLGQELVKVLFELGWIVSQYDLHPIGHVDEKHWYGLKIDDIEYINSILADSIGVIGARVRATGNYHATAWDGTWCYDPTGFIYPLDRFDIETYFRVEKKQNRS
jgi:hypothetical protein